MPRIEEYGAPSVEGNVPLEVSSRPIEEAGQMGRAVQNFGKQFDQLADEQYRRNAQEEVANANADGAVSRANASGALNSAIQEATKNGTNIDAKQLVSDYQDSVDEQADKYTTDHGRNAFTRQAALTKAILIRGGIHAQAQLAGSQATAQHQKAVDANSQAVFQNPSDFLNILRAHNEGVDSQVETGLPANVAEKLKTQDGKLMAMAAVRGWMQIDPDKAEALLNGEGTPDHKGAFSQFFDDNTRHQMQGEIDQKKMHNIAAIGQADRLEEKALKAKTEKWKTNNFDQVMDGSMPIANVEKAVHNGQLTPEAGKEQIALIQRAGAGEHRTDWSLYNSLAKRIGDEQYIDESEIRKHFGRGLTKSNVKDLLDMNGNTDEGKELNVQRKAMYNQIDATARFKDPITQGYSALGEQKRGMAKSDLIKAEKAARDGGGRASDVYDPTNKAYFGKPENLNKYSVPLGQRFTQSAQMLRQDTPAKPTKSIDDFMKDK